MEQRGYMKVKEWFFNKVSAEAKRYNCYIDFKRGEDHMILVEDGYVTVIYDLEAETEKAVNVTLRTGDVLGSYKGWKCWVPKSVIA